MPLKPIRRVFDTVSSSDTDDMDVDTPPSAGRRALRAPPSISSLPSIIKTPKTPKAPIVKPKKATAKIIRRHSSRVDNLVVPSKTSTPKFTARKNQAEAITRPKSAGPKLATQKGPAKKKMPKIEVVESSSSEEESESDSSSESSSDDDNSTPRPAPGSQVLKKKWATHGLYVGQNMQIEGRSTLRALKKNQIIPSSALPLPMYKGLQIMDTETDFVLPYNIFNLTPWVVPKPPNWKSLKRNVFIGESAEIYKRNKQNTWRAHQSTSCACDDEDGCDVNCLNRIMYYECGTSNCRFDDCHNRPFRDLGIRVENDTWFNDGIEIILTKDKGYGLRAVRSFEPNQIIVEYCGEIITQDECDERLNTVYKDNESYYLMEFDNSMIIDATRGSAARFVNHSCSPNCKMEKWMVAGTPRMALFAGNEGIETGEELTYDYNFNWYSGSSTQVCRCGARNCRGSVGKRSDGKKNSPVDDDSSSSKSHRKKKGTVAPKKFAKKGMKASNAKIVRQPLKAKRANDQAPKFKKGNASQINVVKPKGRRLSTTTVEKKSKRTIDEKESTTISLKKTKSKVFKVTKTYSKKQITDSQVVRKTMVEEQPTKSKSKKSADARIRDTLKPSTKATGRGRRNTYNVEALGDALEDAGLMPKRGRGSKKVTLMCPSPAPKGRGGNRRAKKEPVESESSFDSTVDDQASPKTRKSTQTREYSIESESTEDEVLPSKKRKPIASPNAKAIKKAAKKGIPPAKKIPRSKFEDPASNDDTGYETVYESSAAAILAAKRRAQTAKARAVKNGRARSGSITSKKKVKKSKHSSEEGVYPSPTDSAAGKLDSIDSSAFYGGGHGSDTAYSDMLYQRPLNPRPPKRQHESIMNEDVYSYGPASLSESTNSDLDHQQTVGTDNGMTFEPSLGQSAKRQRKSTGDARNQLLSKASESGNSTPTSDSKQTISNRIAGMFGLARGSATEDESVS